MSEQKTSRRDFLKSSAVLGTAATLGLGAKGVHAAGSDMIKIGIIGCGGRGMGAVRNCFQAVPNVKLVSMGELFPDRAQNARKAVSEAFKDRVDVPDSRLFTGIENYKGVIAESEVVLIACASRFHPFYTEAAVSAGKHVFVEKPHGIDAAGIHQTLAAADIAAKNKTALVSGLCYRYDTFRREAVAKIREGLIGDIVAVQSDYIRSPYSLVKREEGWSETEYQFRNWYHFTWLTGDEILQSLLHNLDSVIWALNEDLPESCYGTGGRSSTFLPELGDIYDHTGIVYEYKDGRRIYGATRAAFKCMTSNKDIFHGTKGRCIYTATGIPVITDLKGNEIWRPAAKKRERDMYVQEHYELINSIMANKPINDGHRMAKTTMVAILGMFSIGPVDVKDITLKTETKSKPGADGLYPVPVPGVDKDF